MRDGEPERPRRRVGTGGKYMRGSGGAGMPGFSQFSARMSKVGILTAVSLTGLYHSKRYFECVEEINVAKKRMEGLQSGKDENFRSINAGEKRRLNQFVSDMQTYVDGIYDYGRTQASIFLGMLSLPAHVNFVRGYQQRNYNPRVEVVFGLPNYPYWEKFIKGESFKQLSEGDQKRMKERYLALNKRGHRVALLGSVLFTIGFVSALNYSGLIKVQLGESGERPELSHYVYVPKPQAKDR
eukprot:Nk52_evm10s229 gene=Nk52_evmTU10s229